MPDNKLYNFESSENPSTLDSSSVFIQYFIMCGTFYHCI